MSQTSYPDLFQYLIKKGFLSSRNILTAKDGFTMLKRSLSSILHCAEIDTFPDREGNILQCAAFFDDWFLYCVHGAEAPVYGLLKMREQEHDREAGIQADGDTPGVTVSFISFDPDLLRVCLEEPSAENRKKLGMEINRVVAYPGQIHHPALKAYFIRPEAEAAYLMADVYVKRIASFAQDGVLPVPEAYREIYSKRSKAKRYARVPDFLEENNRSAGITLCDHESIRIADPGNLSAYEKLAILATHTGNVSVHSFAAEIRYHAMFLTPLARIRLPLLGSPYASAVRADMSIGDRELQGPTPYYNLSGRLVTAQKRARGEE